MSIRTEGKTVVSILFVTSEQYKMHDFFTKLFKKLSF